MLAGFDFRGQYKVVYDALQKAIGQIKPASEQLANTKKQWNPAMTAVKQGVGYQQSAELASTTLQNPQANYNSAKFNLQQAVREGETFLAACQRGISSDWHDDGVGRSLENSLAGSAAKAEAHQVATEAGISRNELIKMFKSIEKLIGEASLFIDGRRALENVDNAELPHSGSYYPAFQADQPFDQYHALGPQYSSRPSLAEKFKRMYEPESLPRESYNRHDRGRTNDFESEPVNGIGSGGLEPILGGGDSLIASRPLLEKLNLNGKLDSVDPLSGLSPREHESPQDLSLEQQAAKGYSSIILDLRSYYFVGSPFDGSYGRHGK